MKNISEYASIIENAINNLKLPTDNLPTLYEPIVYGMAAGGKRLRPVLTIMTSDAFGGDINNAINPAIGLEMFHNFTLLHDDVMDNSDLRRGRPTVHKQWNENTAILSGDTMLTLATQLVSDVDDSKLRTTLDTFNRMAIDVYEGQQIDMDFEQRNDVCIDEYIKMITGKTSALLGCAAKIGAIVANASADDQQRMYDFGVSLGVAFQIQDDYLDLYGDAATFGKPIGGDVLNNKKTFLPLTALMSVSNKMSAELNEAFNMPACEEKISRIRELFTSIGVPQKCEETIERYSQLAAKMIDSTNMTNEGKKAFHSLIEKLIKRNK